MRILSQDGMIDVPYEMVGINIWNKIDQKRNAFCVYAHSNSLNGKEIIMAKYSSLEKAQKAMEMLHTAHCGNIERYIDDFVFRAKNYDSRPALLKVLNGAIETVKYFQFPADDELEG